MSERMTPERLNFIRGYFAPGGHPIGAAAEQLGRDLLDELDAVTRERDEAMKTSQARMEYLFHALGFPIRHRWGGDVREFIEGVDAARQRPFDWTLPSSGSYSGMNFITNRDGTIR